MSIQQNTKVEGLSLSLCIAQIIEGHVKEENVTGIVANTRAYTRAQFEEIADGYAKSYWHNNPSGGKALALKFYDAGKISQPRLDHAPAHSVANGIWRPALVAYGA